MSNHGRSELCDRVYQPVSRAGSALAIWYHRKRRLPVFSAGLLLDYCLSVVAVYVCAKAATLILGRVFGWIIVTAAYKYTLIALVCALVLPLLLEFIRKYVGVTLTMEHGDD